MSTSKRRRRAKRRRKAKLRKLIRKILQKRNRELQHAELLSLYQAFIDGHYYRGNITLYRWTHNPNTDDDFRPQIFQSFSDRDISEVELPSSVENSTQVDSYVRKFTVSHYLTEEQAIASYKDMISSMINDGHSEKVANFMNTKGTFVTKCNYTVDDALYRKHKKGHVNVLLCKGFDPKRVVDTTYTPVKIV